MKKEQIVGHYLDHLDGAERAPGWVYKFTDTNKVTKEDFYRHFEDIGQLEQHIWWQQLHTTLQILASDPGYADYSVREKLLAFYFTLLEILNDRSHAFALMLGKSLLPRLTPNALKDFKDDFLSLVKGLIQQGMKSGEIENRPLIPAYYGDAFWLQCLFLLRFWKNDRSVGHAATDEAVERSVNLLFDLLAYTPVDAALGFTKFIYKHKKLLLK